jgi:hypothetical protein
VVNLVLLLHHQLIPQIQAMTADEATFSQSLLKTTAALPLTTVTPWVQFLFSLPLCL